MGSFLLAILLLLILVALVKAKADGEYLYHIEEADGIIHDYDDTSNPTPDFLYGLHQGPRVVEFYAPWCPHVSRLLMDDETVLRDPRLGE